MPRGVLAVVAVGLIATIAAALLTAGKGEGEAAHLEFVQTGKIADSKPTEVPGGGGTMQLTEGRIQATGTNYSAYSLFRVASTLTVTKGSPIGGGRILCKTVSGSPSTEIAHSSNSLRTLYPRSSEGGIFKQEVPQTLLIKFSSHGSELAVLEVDDLKQARFTSEPGVKLGWPQYTPGTERLLYYLHEGKPKRDLVLPFYSLWKSKRPAAAAISCTLETSAGKATTRTAGALSKVSPPIDEEAEAHHTEEREEEKKKGKKKAEPQPAAGATSSSGPSVVPFPTLFSFGFAGALRIRAASSGPHIATASSALRSGRSQAASASALGRIAGIRLWTGATTAFGVVVTIVQL